MKKLAKLFLFCLISFNLLLISCKREGCTDNCANNYDDKAKKDDGSCKYTATIQFWYDKTTGEALQNDGYSAIKIYVNDELIGSYATSVYFTSAPGCEASSVVRKTFDLGNSKTKSITYKVVDANNSSDIIWQGYETLNACDKCLSIQLVKSTKSNEIKYEGNAYPLTKAYIVYYGDDNGEEDYYRFDILLTNDGVTLTEEEEVLGMGNAIGFTMWSSSEDELNTGTYTFDNSDNHYPQTISEGELFLNYNFVNEDGTVYEVTDGSVKVLREGEKYIFEVSFTLKNGKTVTAYYKGLAYFYDFTEEGEKKNAKVSKNCVSDRQNFGKGRSRKPVNRVGSI